MTSLGFVLALTYRRQSAFSRTRKEGIILACKRMFWCLVYLFKALRIGIKFLKTEQLGSKVIYAGRVLYVSNWANSKRPTLSGGGFYKENVPRAEIRPVYSFGEFLHRFMFGVNWYLTNWHDIDVDKHFSK